MDVCKCIVHGGTLNSRKSFREVGGREERWETLDHLQGVFPQNLGGTELNRTVTFVVLKATSNDRRCHDEFRGSRSDYFKQVAAIRDISRSCLDPNDFTVLNCIVKGHASLSPLPCGFVRVRVSPYLLLRPILILKILVLTPIDCVKGHASLSPLAQQKAKKKK
ncbi:uncharacterized protein TNCV_3489411 [Trichonephila clavipes]|nr:uncharacterized protein TNCV_3489411 [Trichonephila clavipes]